MLEECGVPYTAITPDPFWPIVIIPDRVLSIGQIKLFDIQIVYICETELFEIELFLHLTMCKQKIVFLC